MQVLVEKGTIKILIEHLKRSGNLELKEQAIWALGNMAGDNYKIRDIIINQGAVDPISNLLMQAEPGSSFLRNASWTLSNLCRGRPPPDFERIRRAIPALGKTLVENDKNEILTDVCWAISYITDGGEDKI